jgi:hypothetical protein
MEIALVLGGILIGIPVGLLILYLYFVSIFRW